MGDYTTALVFGLVLLITLVLFVRNTIKFFKEGGQEDLPDQKAKVKPTSSSTSGTTSPRVTPGANKIVIGLDRAKGGGPTTEQKSKELAPGGPKVTATEKPQAKVVQQKEPKAEQAVDAQAKAEVQVVKEQKPQEVVAQPATEVKVDVAEVETNGEKPSKTQSKWPPVRMQGPKEEDGKAIEKIENVLSKYFEE